MTRAKDSNTDDDHRGRSLPSKWQSAEKALRATQWAFDLGNTIQQYIRIEAAKNNVTPSDCIRSILKLDVRSKKTRPRLTLSLNEQDLELLAIRYGLNMEESVLIKARAAEEIIDHVNKANNDNVKD